MTIRYSIIIPVYNRPDELSELLNSLQVSLEQWYETRPGNGTPGQNTANRDVEVIVVEDGSGLRCDDVCQLYSRTLNLRYLFQNNAGPAAARNKGAQSARGEWLLFFDSDCLIPEGYFESVSSELAAGNVAFFGGPDRASANFTAVQKAIDYAMTSFLTTGGIRGGKKKLDHYYPRSFNMGVRSDAFENVGGFSGLRFGEDLDLSMRLNENGYHSLFIGDAWVYHKRRTNLKQFFKQVYNSGMARIVLNQLHPGTLKAVHLLPSLFVIYLLMVIVSTPFLAFNLWIPVAIILMILLIDGIYSTGSLSAGLWVPAASLVQITGYGTGLIHAFILVHLFDKKDASAFKDTFYN